MNLLQRALLIISTVTALSWTSRDTQNALHENLSSKKELSTEKIWANTIAIWWWEKDTTSTLPKDPFVNMSNQAIIDDVNRFFEEYLQSASFETRLQNFDRIAKTQAMKHEEIAKVIASAKPTIDKIIEGWILPAWEVIDGFDIWWWNLYYQIGDKKYIINYGFYGNVYVIGKLNKFTYEVERFQTLVNSKAYNITMKEDYNIINDPISFWWMLYNIIIEKESQLWTNTILNWEEIKPIMVTFNNLQIAVARIAQSDITDIEEISSSNIEAERAKRLNNLKQGKVITVPWEPNNERTAYYNNLSVREITYNIGDTKAENIRNELNREIEEYNKRLKTNPSEEEKKQRRDTVNANKARYEELHTPWNIIIYTDEEWIISALDISHETGHKILDWIPNKSELLNHINKCFSELKDYAIENYSNEKRLITYNFDAEEILAKFFSLKYFMYKIWYAKTPWELLNIDTFKIFLNDIEHMPEWKAKQSLNDFIETLKRLFVSDKIDPQLLWRFDWSIASSINTTELYKNVA